MIRLLSLAVPILVMLATAAGVWYSQFVAEGTWEEARASIASRAAVVLGMDINGAMKNMKKVDDDEKLSEQITAVRDSEEIAPVRGDVVRTSYYYACIYVFDSDSGEHKLLWQREIKKDEEYEDAGGRVQRHEWWNPRNRYFCSDKEEVDFSSDKMVAGPDCNTGIYKFNEDKDNKIIECLHEHRGLDRRFWIRTAIGHDMHNDHVVPRSNFLIVTQFPDFGKWTSWKVVNLLAKRQSAVWPALLAILLAVLSATMVRPILKAIRRRIMTWAKVEKKLSDCYKLLLLRADDGAEDLNKGREKRDIDSVVDGLVQMTIARDVDIRNVASWNINAADSELRHALAHIGKFWEEMDENIRAGGMGAGGIAEKTDAAKKEFAQLMDKTLKSVTDSAQLSVMPGPTDCKELFNNVQTWYCKGDESRNVEISCDEDILLPVSPLVFEFMLKELVRNADNYVKDHKCEDSIELRAEKIGKKVVVAVENGGPSVPPKKRDRFFEWGWTEKGTGRGLYLVEQNVKSYGGTVKALDGKLGKGVRIVIELPIAS